MSPTIGEAGKAKQVHSPGSPLFMRAFPERRHAGNNDIVSELPKSIVIEPPFLDDPKAEIINDNVTQGDQFHEYVSSLGSGEVQRHTEFVKIKPGEVSAYQRAHINLREVNLVFGYLRAALASSGRCDACTKAKM